MRVIPPITIDDDILTSSNVPEDDYVEWDSGTTFSLNQYVIIIDEQGSPASFIHKVYRSLIADNLGNDPTADDQDNPTKWIEIGPTNRWKMFDLLRNTQTEIETPLTITLTPGQRVNSIGLVGLDAESVTITMESGGNEVYSTTENLIERQTLTWSDYFFGEFGNKTAISKFDLPPFTDGVITVEISRSSGTVKCGGLVIGNSVYMGQAELNAESDALNFSVIERDEFGDSLLTPRRSIPKTNQRIWVEKSRINKMISLRETLNAVPALWSGLDDDSDDGYFNAFLILGIYKRFLINAATQKKALIDLELEEV